MNEWLQHDPGTGQLILAGPMLASAPPLEKLGLASVPQIAIDGGIRFAHKPVLWTGDGDSGIAPKNAPVFIKHGQDDTDLGFCLKGIHDWKWQELHLFGFLSGRRDHELANFGEIHSGMKSRVAFRQAVFYGAGFTPEVLCFREGTHEVDIHGAFSVMVLSGAEMGVEGACRYAAQNIWLEPLSGRGVSNFGEGRVKLRCGKPFMVLLPEIVS